MNICHNALDRHVNDGQGEQVAIIHDSPVTDRIEKLTFNDLKDEVFLCRDNLFSDLFLISFYDASSSNQKNDTPI